MSAQNTSIRAMLAQNMGARATSAQNTPARPVGGRDGAAQNLNVSLDFLPLVASLRSAALRFCCAALAATRSEKSCRPRARRCQAARPFLAARLHARTGGQHATPAHMPTACMWPC